MTNITATIDVDRPVRTVYNQWTQFEEFPEFMEGVEQVRQLDDATLAWTAQIAGVERSWRARIVEQEPDQVVAWTSIGGVANNGRVSFESLGPDATRVQLSLDVEPEGVVESVGAGLGLIERRAKGDLERFREFIESRPVETGAWRGEIEDGKSSPDPMRDN
ncbi:MAG: SRPBCC family protein [Acidimicrobiia bacterium]